MFASVLSVGEHEGGDQTGPLKLKAANAQAWTCFSWGLFFINPALCILST